MLNAGENQTDRQRLIPQGGLLILIFGALGISTLPCFAAEPPLPDPAYVTRQLIDHSQGLAKTNGGPKYIYPKHTLIERLDSSGEVTSSEERFYEVTLIGGIPINRLLKIKDREMTPDELQTEQDREDRFQQKVSSMDPKKLVARRQGLVTAELLDHYQYVVSKRIQINGRSTLVVDFKPKDEPVAANSMRDRVLNRIAGTLWVDEGDWELEKVSAHLTETISMGWFGLLGSLSVCELSLDRQRMPDGICVNTKQVWAIQFRKLASTTRFRITETSENFRRADGK